MSDTTTPVGREVEGVRGPSRTSGGGAAPPPRPRWRRWAVVVGALVLAGGAAFAFVRSPFFDADRISVRGADHLSTAKVLRLAGIGEDTNVASLDAGAAVRQLEADPWIADATVTKDLPDAVEVAIRERAPLATVEGSGGWEVLAGDGTVLATQERQPRLPVLTGAVAGAASGGLAVLTPMNEDLLAEVGSVTVDAAGDVDLTLAGGVTVAYGPLTETSAKAQALEAVLAWAAREDENLAQLDVRVPGAPTARVAGGAVVTP